MSKPAADSADRLLLQGRVMEAETKSKTTLLALKDSADRTERIFSTTGIAVSESLADLFEAARAACDSWLAARPVEPDTALKAMYMQRIARVVFALETLDQREKYLRTLANGHLDLNRQHRSLAKDILWELELWVKLNERGLDAELSEPPDIVLAPQSEGFGIACKKVYSERNVNKVLSQGVAQYERKFPTGLVAFNVDDLIPDGHFVRGRNNVEVRSIFLTILEGFLNRHLNTFARYVSQRRMAGVLVSVGGAVELTHELPALNNNREWSIWTMEGLTAPHAGAAAYLKQLAQS
jgi:hypothetical protein